MKRQYFATWIIGNFAQRNVDAEAVHIMCRAYRLNDERFAAYAQSKKTDAKSVASKVWMQSVNLLQLFEAHYLSLSAPHRSAPCSPSSPSCKCRQCRPTAT